MSSKTDSLSTKQWALLQSLFDQAMELPEDQRHSFLETSCAGNPNLRKQVDALILAADADEELVSNLIRTAADQVLEKNNKTRSQIGSFKIVDVIGTGGMGVVYLGQRTDDEYKQQVAIKILHDGLDSEEALLRFKTERQILANLNHPNIARLLDGGHTEDDRPYLVMEYVDGVPLVDYCDQRRLSVKARLELFKQVCSAVAAAHRSLVVHRDIKPSNILVDSEGIPKLLDFGIAKVLNNRFEQRDLAKTQFGDRLLTPDFASPEQVQGLPITTSSDIYSLGVLLYQLLCGSRPFRLVDKTPAEMEKIVLTETPVPPSRAIGTVSKRTENSRAVAADRRATTPEKLRRVLSGELDFIALMALKKEPQRRYASASQLAADIDKYQQGQPIVAVRDTRRYVAKKFFQRNRITVIASGLLMLSLFGFSIMTYQQSKSIAFEKNVSENALDFLTDVFESSSPGALQKEVVTAIDILDVGAAQVEEKLQGQPAPRATLQRIIGLAYASNQRVDKAFTHLARSLETRTEIYGPDNPYTADVLQNLGNLHLTEGQADKAIPLLEQALAVYQNSTSKRFFKNDKVKGRHAIQVALGDLSDAYEQFGQVDLAIETAEKAYDIAMSLSETDRYPYDEPNLLLALSGLMRQKGEYAKAEEMILLALKLSESRFGADSLIVANLTASYARMNHGLDRLELAEELYRKSLRLREGKLAPTTAVLLRNKRNLGRLLRDKNELEQALTILIDVVEQLRKYHGELLPYSASADIIDLSRVYIDLDQFAVAEQLLEEAFDIHMRTSGKNNNFFCEVLREQGNLYVATRRPEQAVIKFAESVEILESMYGNSHWQTAANRSEKAEAHIALGEFEEAANLLEQALPVLSKLLGPNHRLSRAALDRQNRLDEHEEGVSVTSTTS